MTTKTKPKPKPTTKTKPAAAAVAKRTRTIPKAEPAKPEKRVGRPPRGATAEEARWHCKVTLAEDLMLDRLAGIVTGGNRSDLLRLAVKRLAESMKL